VISNRPFRRIEWIAALLCLAAFASRASAVLVPDEILLITNKNSPDSQKLAQMYCKLRGVPPTQIVALDLPNDEEMPFSIYETNVVAPIRQFLEEHQLRSKVKCLLTFYGVPFRIRAKQNTMAEDQELADLRKSKQFLTAQIAQTVTDLETQAAGIDRLFRPGVGDSLAALMGRGHAAMSTIASAIPTLPDASARNQQARQLIDAIATIGGIIDVDERMGRSQRDDPNANDKQRQTWGEIHEQATAAQARMTLLENARWDPLARDELRKVARDSDGLLGTLRIVEAQITYLTITATTSATDNELALLWWNYYPRQHSLPNPLNLDYPPSSSPTLMVMRLDGPDPDSVRRIMQISVDVETTGLRGTVAIDARGISPTDDNGKPNAYGEFDQTLRNLAYFLRTKTNLKIKFDDQDMVFPPHSVKNVALYVGWYSVNQYIPGCDFNPGAVGYHIASFELATLHAPSSHWVRGLIHDGVVATLGPVDEPYLTAFPNPDEFFPLLLTGKLTLAEVYWKTCPMTSWMISFIGDPLYRPYLHDPALKIDDLPGRLRRAFQESDSTLTGTPSNSSHTNN
jgi:uncharacterized protein (TIGR03790 family)